MMKNLINVYKLTIKDIGKETNDNKNKSKANSSVYTNELEFIKRKV